MNSYAPLLVIPVLVVLVERMIGRLTLRGIIARL